MRSILHVVARRWLCPTVLALAAAPPLVTGCHNAYTDRGPRDGYNYQSAPPGEGGANFHGGKRPWPAAGREASPPPSLPPPMPAGSALAPASSAPGPASSAPGPATFASPR